MANVSSWSNSLILALVLTLAPELARAEPGSNPERPPGESIEQHSATMARAGWIASGVGAAFAIGGSVLWVVGAEKADEIGVVGDTRDRAAMVETRETAEAYLVTGQVMVLAGAAALVTGLTLVLLSSDDHEAHSSMRVGVAPNQLLLAGSF